MKTLYMDSQRTHKVINVEKFNNKIQILPRQFIDNIDFFLLCIRCYAEIIVIN